MCGMSQFKAVAALCHRPRRAHLLRALQMDPGGGREGEASHLGRPFPPQPPAFPQRGLRTVGSSPLPSEAPAFSLLPSQGHRVAHLKFPNTQTCTYTKQLGQSASSVSAGLVLCHREFLFPSGQLGGSCVKSFTFQSEFSAMRWNPSGSYGFLVQSCPTVRGGGCPCIHAFLQGGSSNLSQ